MKIFYVTAMTQILRWLIMKSKKLLLCIMHNEALDRASRKFYQITRSIQREKSCIQEVK